MRLYEQGADKFMKNLKATSKPYFYYNKLFKKPNNVEVIRLVAKKYLKKLKNRIRNILFFEQWIIFYDISSSENMRKSFYRFKRMLPPKDRFWADPFVLHWKNKYYIFMEEFIYRENKGHISISEIDSEGNYTKPKK